LSSTDKVLVFNTSPVTLIQDVERILQMSSLTKHLNTKKKTLVKINANYDRNYPGCNTSTWFLDALLLSLKKLGFTDLTAVESDLKLQPAERTIKAIGISDVLEKHKVPFLNLESCPHGEDGLPLVIHRAQVISVPLIHTHPHAVVSCASKNLFGLLPVYREKFHNELSSKLLELVQSVNPCFTIVDGTVGQEGSSMRMGDPKCLDLVLSGWNPLTVDLVVAKMMGLMADVPLLQLAKKRGLLSNSVVVTGDYDWKSLPAFHFIFSKHTFGRLDLWFRRNALTKNLFEYNSFLDKFAQYARRAYLSIKFHSKKKRIYNGTWTKYSR
jgi:uncharacterized protein (DUF362 family)